MVTAAALWLQDEKRGRGSRAEQGKMRAKQDDLLFGVVRQLISYNFQYEEKSKGKIRKKKIERIDTTNSKFI